MLEAKWNEMKKPSFQVGPISEVKHIQKTSSWLWMDLLNMIQFVPVLVNDMDSFYELELSKMYPVEAIFDFLSVSVLYIATKKEFRVSQRVSWYNLD